MSVTLLHVRYVSVTSVTQHLPPSLHYYTSVTAVTQHLSTPPITVTHVRYMSVTSVTSPLYPHTSVTFVTRSDLTKPYAWNETHCQVNSTGLTLLRQYFSAPARRLALLETLNRASLPSDRTGAGGAREERL